jgi:hypothetical protein
MSSVVVFIIRITLAASSLYPTALAISPVVLYCRTVEGGAILNVDAYHEIVALISKRKVLLSRRNHQFVEQIFHGNAKVLRRKSYKTDVQNCIRENFDENL